MRSFGTEAALSRALSSGTVDAGWRVASFPSRVGPRARVLERGHRL
jgi:hypothetical protein